MSRRPEPIHALDLAAFGEPRDVVAGAEGERLDCHRRLASWSAPRSAQLGAPFRQAATGSTRAYIRHPPVTIARRRIHAPPQLRLSRVSLRAPARALKPARRTTDPWIWCHVDHGQSRSGGEEDSRAYRHRSVEAHQRCGAVGRRRLDDLRLPAERGRRHALRPPAHWRQDLHDSCRLGGAVLRRLTFRRLLREPERRARRAGGPRRRWRRAWCPSRNASARGTEPTVRGARSDHRRQVPRSRRRDLQVF